MFTFCLSLTVLLISTTASTCWTVTVGLRSVRHLLVVT